MQDEHDSCWIDGFGPVTVRRPRVVAEVGELVRQAAAAGHAVYSLGGRTALHVGLPPTRAGIALDLSALDQLIDYPARDMTITVQAGMTVARLQQILAQENQRLPVDVPLPDRATLGGAIAVNASGPQRYGFGTLRDYLIGITVVNDEGQEVKAGGRVVKNVAGYDLCKLYTGSLGSLGIITQVTLKVRPLPEAATVGTFRCRLSEAESLLELLHRSRTRPVCLDLSSPPAAESVSDQWAVLVGLEGNAEGVAWQTGQLQAELGLRSSGLTWATGGAVQPLYQTLTDEQARLDAVLTFKASMLPHRVAAFCRHAAVLPGLTHLHAHAGNGIVFGYGTGDFSLVSAKSMLTALQEAAGTEGNVTVLRCPPAWKGELLLWGRPRGDAFLMRTVKEHLDPRGLFNPGRMAFL